MVRSLPESSLARRADFFKERLLAWSLSNLRDFPWRRTTDPYVVLVTEKLLQQTDYGHVKKIWENFFARFPSVSELARSSVEVIEDAIRSLGLWRQRARQLKTLAEVLILEHGGTVPCDYGKLIKLPGVGDYVARAVLVFACGKPTYLLDTNSRKVISRFFYYPEKVSDSHIVVVLDYVTPRDSNDCKLFYWGLIDFSALLCSRSPKCKRCPLSQECSYYHHRYVAKS